MFLISFAFEMFSYILFSRGKIIEMLMTIKKPIALFIVTCTILTACYNGGTVVGKWNRLGQSDPSEVRRIEINYTHANKYSVVPNLPNLPFPFCTGDDLSIDCSDGKTTIMSLRLEGDLLIVKYKGQEFRFTRE